MRPSPPTTFRCRRPAPPRRPGSPRTYSPRRDAGGKVVGVVGVLKDVSDRRRLEQQSSGVEPQFRTLVEQSLVGMYVIQDGRYRYANPKLGAIFGYTQEELLALDSVLDLVAEEDRDMVLESLRKRIAGEAADGPLCLPRSAQGRGADRGRGARLLDGNRRPPRRDRHAARRHGPPAQRGADRGAGLQRPADEAPQPRALPRARRARARAVPPPQPAPGDRVPGPGPLQADQRHAGPRDRRHAPPVPRAAAEAQPAPGRHDRPGRRRRVRHPDARRPAVAADDDGRPEAAGRGRPPVPTGRARRADHGEHGDRDVSRRTAKTPKPCCATPTPRCTAPRSSAETTFSSARRS